MRSRTLLGHVPLALLGLLALALGCEARASRPSELSPDGPAPPQAATPEPAVSPSVKLVVVSSLLGVLEPCGCGGRPVGGLDRVAGELAALRRQTTPVALLAIGDLLYGPQPPEQPLDAQTVLEADAMAALVGALQPRLLAPGAGDLQLGPQQLIGVRRAARPAVVVSAATPPIEGLDARTEAVLEVGGHRVALFTTRSAAPEQTTHAVAALRAQGAQSVVRIEHAAQAQTHGAASVSANEADVVILTGAGTEGASEAQGTLVVSTGKHGESLWIIELSFDGAREGSAGARATAQRIELGQEAPVDEPARRLLDQTFARIRSLNASRAAELAGDAADPEQPTFVGARTCAACHTGAYLWWQGTGHGRAFATLKARGRELDLDCIGCHVTGFGMQGGARIGRLEERTGVGCESCHGPSARHADNPQAKDSTRRHVADAVCTGCHDAEHSPAFDDARARALLVSNAHAPTGARSGGARTAPQDDRRRGEDEPDHRSDRQPAR